VSLREIDLDEVARERLGGRIREVVLRELAALDLHGTASLDPGPATRLGLRDIGIILGMIFDGSIRA
jgi:hypothetical protein